MSSLPSSVEAYLKEANFSSTELLVLKRLLQDDALTLREIAAKTGKSTGVLDQAVKKLIAKSIVTKEGINDTSKYSIKSLEPILAWLAKDTEEKHQEQLRKHKDFEAFVHSLDRDKKRPEMQYYEGTEGIKQAYWKLLDLVERKHSVINGQTGEMLHYIPVTTTIEDDPLRDFWVDFFRARRRLGIFSRMVAHDTPLGRRFQTRDPFEFRKTILVEEAQYPFEFEKIIVGDTIACINFNEKKACFINYPDLAKSERSMFNKLWAKKTAPPTVPQASSLQHVIATPKVESVSLSTRTLSSLREFFLAKRSIGTFVVLGLVAAGLTYMLYQQNVYLNKERIRDKALSVASTAALQFENQDLEQLRTVADIEKPEYAKVVYQLNEIRRLNEDVRYVYIMRPTDNAKNWEFVADADSLDPFAKKDLNEDGKIDAADLLSPPGQLFTGNDTALMSKALVSPVVGTEPSPTQWGTFISAFAPIKREGGAQAVLGVDIYAEKIYELTQNTFTPILWFLGLFLVFVFIRLAAFNRSLFKEICELVRIRKVLIITSISALTSIAVTFGLYQYTQELNLSRMKDQVQAIALTGVSQFNPNDVAALQVEEDWKKPEWPKVVGQLKEIRQQNKNITFVYLVGKDKSDSSKTTFIADSHSLNPYANVDEDKTNDVDANSDGKIESQGSDLLQWPSQVYEEAPPEAIEAFNGPTTNKNFYEDKWGKFISGYAPLKDQNENVIAVLAVDMKANFQNILTNQVFAPIYVFLSFFVLFVLFRFPGFNKSLLHQVIIILNKRKILVALLFAALCALAITFLLYLHTVRLMKDQIGQRFMSIVSTAVPEIDPEDINKIRVKEDWEKDEYQRVYSILNKIRQRNTDIEYAYILRKTEEKNIYEFVADADSNYFLSSYIDTNNNGISEPDEENVWPGLKYDPANANTLEFQQAYSQPIYETDFYEDQWGKSLSAYAPIINSDGETIAILGIDIDLTDFLKLTKEKFKIWVWFFGILMIIFLIQIFYLTLRNRSDKNNE